ncbi:hypothetical protein N8940_01695 [Sphingomonadaceae bacterium]|nr:hypothetical protein [Sphingomonadaceae bacterium]
MDMMGQSDPLGAALRRELMRGEKIRWQGRQLARVNRGAFAIYLFAIPWTAFALFWMAMASGFGSSASAGSDDFDLFSKAFPLFGLPFVLIGIAMFLSPFWPLIGARNTAFAVTDQRIIRLTLARTLKTETVPPESIGRITKNERRDGSGTVTVVTGTAAGRRGRTYSRTFKLGEVESVHGAGEAITRLAETANPDGERY